MYGSGSVPRIAEDGDRGWKAPDGAAEEEDGGPKMTGVTKATKVEHLEYPAAVGPGELQKTPTEERSTAAVPECPRESEPGPTAPTSVPAEMAERRRAGPTKTPAKSLK